MNKIIEVAQKLESNDLSALDFLEKALIDFYQFIDSIIGRSLEVLKKTEDDFFFFIVSDHGFTTRPYAFNLGRWLIENGYMKLKKKEFKHSRTTSLLISRILNLWGRSAYLGAYLGVLEYCLRILPNSILNRLTSFARAQLKLLDDSILSSQVDFNHSKAFCVEDGAIYANSSINEGSFQEELAEKLDRFIRLTYGFPDLKLRALRKKEIYWGDKVELAPDLTIEILEKDRIWEITTDPGKPIVSRPRLPGKHDHLGILCAYGPQIKEGVWFDDLMIWDVAPTILRLFDVAVPVDMDGRFLTELFKEGSNMAQRPVKYWLDERERIRRVVEKLRTRAIAGEHD